MIPSPDSNNHVASSHPLPDTDDDQAKATVAELREDLALIAAEFKKVVAERSAAAGAASAEVLQDGLDTTRNAIRANPLAGMLVAAAAGLIIANVIIPAPRRSMSARVTNWMPDVSRADVAAMAEQVRRSAVSGGSSMLGAFERVVDSISTIDPKTNITPTLEKAANWMGSVMAGMRSK